MWKKRILCLVLVLCAVLLSACAPKQTFRTKDESGESEQAGTQQQEAEAAAPQDVFDNAVVDSSTDYDHGSYNPADEEDPDPEIIQEAAAPVSAPPTMQSEYAGATPVIIDPIDKPTATPLPKLTFAYTTYEAAALHLTFDAPSNWIVDDTQPDTYSLTNPDPSVDYAASLTIRAIPVNKSYSKNDLTKEIKGMLETRRSEGFKSFSNSNTASRTFLNSAGIYVNYSGTLDNDVKVAGRIIVSCPGKTLYVLHVTYPQGYTDTYVDGVFNKFRHTVKLNQGSASST